MPVAVAHENWKGYCIPDGGTGEQGFPCIGYFPVKDRLKVPDRLWCFVHLLFFSQHILYSRFACANTAFIAFYCVILIERNKE